MSASVAPEWAWKQPTQVEDETDHTLISPDTEPEHSMDDEEKQTLRTERLCPQSDWGKPKKRVNCILTKKRNQHLIASS